MTFALKPEPKYGTIAEILNEDSITAISNDGNNEYFHIQEECKNQLPVSGTTELKIPLTNPNIDIVQFDKSFIQIEARFNLNLTMPEELTYQAKASASDLEKFTEYFVGFKNSSDCIKTYALYHRGKQVGGTRQSNATLESFCYHAYRGEEELSRRRGVHSRAEEINDSNFPVFCGKEITLADLRNAANTKKLAFGFVLTIPFNDVLLFQQFEAYPAALFGDLEIRLTFNPDALVVLPENIETIMKTMKQGDAGALTTLSDGRYTFYAPAANAHYPTHEFTQIGDTFTAISTIDASKKIDITGGASMFQVLYNTGEFKFEVDSYSITNCSSNIVGYNVRPDALEALRVEFATKPWVKFSQNITYFPYTGNLSNVKDISLTQQIYLNNTTDFILRFPTTEHERENTVSKNPTLDNLSLTIMNRRYPEREISSYGSRFSEMMLNSSDSLFMIPNKEYVNSIANRRWNDTGEEFNFSTDATSFLLTIKVERPSALGLICDGLDSNGQQVSARLHAVPNCDIASNPYFKASPPAPELITVNDSYFIFSSADGGRCIYSDIDFNEALQNFMGTSAEEGTYSRRGAQNMSD